MPQEKRSYVNIELLKWLHAKTKRGGGATRREIVSHVILEVTDLGATKRTVLNYLQTCLELGLVSIHRNRYRLTSVGKNWLERKVS